MLKQINSITRTKIPVIGVALDYFRAQLCIPKYKYAVPYLATNDLKPRSTTLHILGSGPSINSISADRWMDISKSDSFGINFFLAHHFVPDLLSLEFKIKTINTESPLCFFRLINSRGRELSERGTLIILKLNGDLSDKNSVSSILSIIRQEIPENLWPNLRFARVTNFHPANHCGLTTSLNWIDARGLLSQQKHRERFVQMRASVVFALLIGMRMNYQRIVLHGFDMGPGNYFYTEPSGGTFLEDPYLQSLKLLPVHRTNDVELGYATVPVVLEQLNHLAMASGIEIFVGTPGHGSPLDSFLPTY